VCIRRLRESCAPAASRDASGQDPACGLLKFDFRMRMNILFDPRSAFRRAPRMVAFRPAAA